MNQQAGLEEYDEPRPQGFFSRMRDRLMGHDEYDEDEDTAPESDSHKASAHASTQNPPRRTPAPTLRLDQARHTHVTVRRAVRGFDDARRAADGLKEGQQQIVNLEQTPVEMGERIVDFLNGATYALDGSVEKIGEQVYLFTPASVTIDIEDKPAGNARVSFIDAVS